MGDVVERLGEYAKDWCVRAGSKAIVDEAAETILSLRAQLAEQSEHAEALREILVKARRALSCYRCGGDGFVTTMLGEPDECPACRGEDHPTDLMREIDAALAQPKGSGQ